jgi:hypothetical protein
MQAYKGALQPQSAKKAGMTWQPYPQLALCINTIYAMHLNKYQKKASEATLQMPILNATS